MNDDLWMRHKDLPENPAAPVTRLAYETTWAPRGWELVDTPAEHSELADRPAADTPEREQSPAEADETPDTDSDAGPAKGAGRTGRKSS